MKISVITSTYNNEKEIKMLYDSLVGQKEYVYEWIVADDGSFDDTWGVVNYLADRAPFPVEGMQQIKHGSRYAANLNNAAKRAKGDIVFSVNGDSYLASDALEQLSKSFIKGSAGSALRINLDKDGNFSSYDWRVPNGTKDIREVTKEPDYWTLLTGNGIIVEKKSLEKIGYWDDEYKGYGREDWDIFFRLGKIVPVYQYNNVRLYVEAEENGPKPDDPENVARFERRVKEYENGSL